MIEGQKLAELMIDHGIGVTTTQTYAIRKMDLDYFADGEG